MSTKNNFVFKALHVIAWIIFVGLSIEAGALILNFIFSLFKPEFVQNLYQKLDLTDMYAVNPWIFYGMYSFILFIAIMKAYLFYQVIMLVNKLDLTKPFSTYAADQITNISYNIFSIGLISYIARQTAKSLPHYGFNTDTLNHFWADSEAYILMAAVVYVIATIFSRGVEIQNENDLTV